MADELDILYSTTAPNGTISARQGRIALYNNSGTYQLWVNKDGATAWQRLADYDANIISIASPSQGDILYHNGTSWTKLSAGTSGLLLKTQGAGANPVWGLPADLAITSQAQGDVLYFNGTNWVRLAAGTSGYFLKTQGAGANPVWAVPTGYSNVLFQYSPGYVLSSGNPGGGSKMVSAADLTTGWDGTIANHYIAYSANPAAYKTIWTTKFVKIASVSTVTVYGEIWDLSGGDTVNLKVDIGGQNGSSSTSATSPTFVNFTIDVSSLTNGTVYTVTVSISNGSNGNAMGFSQVIGFGS